MNKIFFALTLLILVACKSKTDDKYLDPSLVDNPATANKTLDDNEYAIIDFEAEQHDFGTIKEGTLAKCKFKFKNTGEQDLIIGDAKGSCGCTVPNFPTKPIAEGETGEIDVTFNSSGKKGFQSKTVTVITNCKVRTKTLVIKANVIPVKL
jgi:hypothetical protein